MLRQVVPTLLLLAAACAPGSGPAGSVAQATGGPATGNPPSAEPGIDLRLGPVDLPDPRRVRALRAGGRAGGGERDRGRPAGPAPTPVHLGGRVDDLSMLTQNQIHQLGGRRIARVFAVPSVPSLYTIVLSNTGSGWQETFLLQTPPVASGMPAPLLVCFHKFGVSQNDILNRTTFFEEAAARGWYCVAPLGATQVSFGTLASQINVRAALEHVTGLFPIDRSRIYAAGFSMGGGAALTYGARQLDPNGLMFAAIANHTGSVALPHVYANEQDDNDADDNIPDFGSNLEVPDILEYWCGGIPAFASWGYLRFSMMDLDPLTNQVASGPTLAGNLAHVPILNWVAALDPTAYLYEQTQAFQRHVVGLNAQNTLVVAAGNVHSWATLDEAAVCTWLAQFTLQLPTGGTTVADEDGVWLRFHVQQDRRGAFTPFTWNADSSANRLTLSATSNLARLHVETDELGLAPTAPLTLVVSTADATGDELVLHDYPNVPASVRRDGLSAPFVHDPVARTVTILELDGALHAWQIQP